MRRLYLLLVVAVLGLGAARAEVLLYGPGGMGSALDEVVAAAQRDGVKITLVTGHSPAQARQIVDGAPVDIFISADPQWMAFLKERGLLSEGGAVDLADTKLVLIAPAQSHLAYTARPGESLAAQLGDGKLAIGDPYMLPAGRFARQALEKLGAWQGLEGHLALEGDVRAVVALVDRGEVPAGISFACESADDPKLRVVTEFPSQLVPPLEFPIAVLAGRERPEVAAAFAFLRGPKTLAILSRHGFVSPGG